jgi:hypothetical protein
LAKGGTTMPCFFLPTKKLRNFPFESFVKMFGIGFHAFMELKTGIHQTGEDKHLMLEYENAHHVIMLSGFMVGTIVEIIIYFGAPLPKYSEYMFNLLAFLIQVLVMGGHLHGDLGLELKVHELWTWIIVLNFIGCCLETYNPDSFWAAYMRIFFFFAQGTWLMQVAFVVWPGKNPLFVWKDDHASHTWLTVSAMLHLIGVSLVLMVQPSPISRISRRPALIIGSTVKIIPATNFSNVPGRP